MEGQGEHENGVAVGFRFNWDRPFSERMFIDQFISQTLSGIKLIGLGETVHGAHSAVLEKILSKFDSSSGIFLEFPSDYQFSFDSFVLKGKADSEIQKLINGAIRENKDIGKTLKVLAMIGNKKHIPVICIDSSKIKTFEYQNKSEDGFWFFRGRSREEDMFTNIIRNINLSKRKWILIGGSAHIKYGINYQSGESSLGKRLKEKLGKAYYSICLWQIDNFLDNLKCFDCRGNPSNRYLNLLFQRHKISNLDELGQKYFDGYIIHG